MRLFGFEEREDLLFELCGVAGAAFPDDEYIPAELFELLAIAAIAFHVAGALGFPEFRVG